MNADIESIRTDILYALRQLREHRCIDRAVDALERVECELERLSMEDASTSYEYNPDEEVDLTTPTPGLVPQSVAVSDTFLHTMRVWLEDQYPCCGSGDESFDDAVALTVDNCKEEITTDIADGAVPATVASFSDLHTYVDANWYGGMCDWEVLTSDEDDRLVFMNLVQTEVDKWLKEGRP